MPVRTVGAIINRQTGILEIITGEYYSPLLGDPVILFRPPQGYAEHTTKTHTDKFQNGTDISVPYVIQHKDVREDSRGDYQSPEKNITVTASINHPTGIPQCRASIYACRKQGYAEHKNKNRHG